VLEAPLASLIWASTYTEPRERLPRLSVPGGCCGTDHRLAVEIRDSWLGSAPE
jgi:hypothetical protein